jgi:phosphohistidine phosphatase
MRRLIIFRHAKAERLQPGGSDLSRRLEPRGRNDAEAMGAYLAKHKLVPDLAAVSTSARTRETWAFAGAAFAPPPPVSFDGRIYNAEIDDILAVIAETDPKAETLAVVGHNPGFHELAVLLAGSGEAKDRQRLAEGFPTAGVAVLEFKGSDWRLRPQSGRLERFVSPKTVSAATD